MAFGNHKIRVGVFSAELQVFFKMSISIQETEEWKVQILSQQWKAQIPAEEKYNYDVRKYFPTWHPCASKYYCPCSQQFVQQLQTAIPHKLAPAFILAGTDTTTCRRLVKSKLTSVKKTATGRCWALKQLLHCNYQPRYSLQPVVWKITPIQLCWQKVILVQSAPCNKFILLSHLRNSHTPLCQSWEGCCP